MNDQTMTVGEALNITIANLEGIMLPVNLCDTVGVTIKSSINNIRACIEAMRANEQKKEAEGSGDGREDDAE